MHFFIFSFSLHLMVLVLLFFNFEQPDKYLDKGLSRSVAVELKSSSISKLENTSFKKLQKKVTIGEKKETPVAQQTDPLNSKRVMAESLSYAEELKVYIEQRKKYPRLALRLKQVGTVKVKLQIDEEGSFRNVKIVNPSSYPVLNQAALNLLKKLGKFKPLPKSIKAQSDFIIPIAYMLKGL